jgi:hypothetical protein
METAASLPVPDPLGLCRFWGDSRNGATSMLAGVFQHMGVLPDGSGVVFEVTPQVSLPIGTAELPQGEGIFFVRADGSGLGGSGRRAAFELSWPPTTRSLSAGSLSVGQ